MVTMHTRLEEVERLAFALADTNNTEEVHISLMGMLSAVRKAPESSFLPPRQVTPPAAPAAAPTLNPPASIAPLPPPPVNALPQVGSPQPGSALASAVASFGSVLPPPPTLPPLATPVTAPPFDIRPPGQTRPAVTLHATLLPTSLRVTPSRKHPACIDKFTSIPGSKDVQLIISSEPHAWAIHVKGTGVKQDDCAVFRVKFFRWRRLKSLSSRSRSLPHGSSQPPSGRTRRLVPDLLRIPHLRGRSMHLSIRRLECISMHRDAPSLPDVPWHPSFRLRLRNGPIGHSARTSGQH